MVDNRARGVIMIVIGVVLIAPVGLIVLLRSIIPPRTMDDFGRAIPPTRAEMSPLNVMLLVMVASLGVMLCVYGVTMYRSGKTNVALGCIVGVLTILLLLSFYSLRTMRLV
jgi:multisubunit Na+/H+ antiporter MnhG subunit